MTKKVLIIGCGDLGSELAVQLPANAFLPIGLRRSAVTHSIFQCVQADVLEPSTLTGIANINPDFVVYCVAATAQTDENYRLHYVEGLRNVLNALKTASNLKHVFFVSSTRMYGQVTNDLLDESTAPEATDFGGERLLEAEGLLKQYAENCSSTSLRLTGIYGPGRTRMLTLATHPSHWPMQNTWTNRIHRDDAAGFIVHLMQMLISARPVQDCYIVTDSCPVSQYEVLHWIAHQMGLISAQASPPVIGGKRMSNQRMLATGFHMKYADYKLGYSEMLDKT